MDRWDRLAFRIVAVVAFGWAVLLLVAGTVITMLAGMSCGDCPLVGLAFWGNVAGQLAAMGWSVWLLVRPSQDGTGLMAAVLTSSGSLALTIAIVCVA